MAISEKSGETLKKLTIEMRSQFLAVLLIVLVAYQPADASEDYFKKSILKALKEKNGQFSSRYKATAASKNRTILVDDKFNFKLNVQAMTIKSNAMTSRFLLVNSSEVYIVDERTRECMSSSFNKTMLKRFLAKIAKDEVYKPELDYKIYGKRMASLKLFGFECHKLKHKLTNYLF